MKIILPKISLPAWLPRIEFENESRPVVIPNQSARNNGYGYSDYIAERQQTLETITEAKSLFIDKMKSARKFKSEGRLKLLPAYSVYASAYYKFPALQAGTDKISNYILGLRDYFVDKNGKEHPKVLEEFERRFGNLDNYKNKASKQFTIFGQCIDNKYDTYSSEKDKSVGFRLIPSSETSNYIVDEKGLIVTKFSWNRNEIYTYNTIERFDLSGDQNFHVEKNEDLEDLFVGDSKVSSCLTTMDSYFRDDLNYQLFLKNGGYPVVIALVAGEEIAKAEIESVFRSLRDPDMRYRVPVINNAAGANGEPMVRFETFKPDIGERLTSEEKKEMEGRVYDCLHISRKLMGFGTSGLGSNEYEIALRDTKISAIDPMVRMIRNLGNNFRIPEGLKLMEKSKFFEQAEIKVSENGVERTAIADDFTWHIEELDVGDKEKKRFNLTESYRIGIFTVAEVKKQGWGYEEKDLLPDDNKRIFELEKMGDTQQSNQSKPNTPESEDDDNEEDDSNEREDPEEPVVEKTEKTVTTAKLLKQKSFTINSGKTKQKIAKYLEKAKAESGSDYSQIPSLLNLPERQQLEEEIRQSLVKQYNSVDFKKLIKLAKEKNVNIYNEEEITSLKKDLESVISKEAGKIKDIIDPAILILLLLFFARVGNQETINLATLSSVVISPEQKAKAKEYYEKYINERVDNLLFGEPAKKEKKVVVDGFTPYYEGMLDSTSYNQIIDIIFGVVITNPNLTEEEAISQIKDSISAIAESRASKIAIDNIVKAYTAGIIFTSLSAGVKEFIWMPTKAKNPNEIHRKQWYVVSTLKKGWASRDLPGQRISCLCSLRPIFKKNIS